MSDPIGGLNDALQAVDQLTRNLIEVGAEGTERVRATLGLELKHAITRAEALAHPTTIGIEPSAELLRRYQKVRAAAHAVLADNAGPRPMGRLDRDVDRASADRPAEPGRSERRRGERRDTRPQTPSALRRAMGEHPKIDVAADVRGAQGAEGDRR